MRVRNLQVIEVPVGSIHDSAFNFRTHDAVQTEALATTVDQIGWYSYPVVYKIAKGYRLIDGHLRVGLLKSKGIKRVKVLLTDFTRSEALQAMATHDPLADTV
jgi:ParB-like chromosome segregation protein Spo0J